MWVITASSIVHWLVVLATLGLLREHHEPTEGEEWPGWSTSQIALPLVGLFILSSEAIRLTFEQWLLTGPSRAGPAVLPAVLQVHPLAIPVFGAACILVVGWLCAFRISWFRASLVGVTLVLLRLGLMWFAPDWMNGPVAQLFGR